MQALLARHPTLTNDCHQCEQAIDRQPRGLHQLIALAFPA